ncbi:MAG: 4'-phosphopantetheinyl transferase superfamily protein [Firmicutes bacterium]|nr:4'-phosphopantetheinyl transferase superfamily protein [Bacillota bacterium]
MQQLQNLQPFPQKKRKNPLLRINDKIETMSGEALLAELSLLPEWRRREALRYSHIAGRRESTMAFRLLQEMTGIRDLEFSLGEHGKPEIKGRPDIRFNLSHCRCAVACAVDSVPVGVDIERTGRYSRSLAERTLSAAELHSILYASEDTSLARKPEETDLMFTVLWTKKEALLKLLGTGIGLTENVRRVLGDYEGMVVFDTVIDRERRYVCTEARFTVREDS